MSLYEAQEECGVSPSNESAEYEAESAASARSVRARAALRTAARFAVERDARMLSRCPSPSPSDDGGAMASDGSSESSDSR